MGITRFIGAGDSIPDIPMLKTSDLAILPNNLSDSVEHVQKKLLIIHNVSRVTFAMCCQK